MGDGGNLASLGWTGTVFEYLTLAVLLPLNFFFFFLLSPQANFSSRVSSTLFLDFGRPFFKPNSQAFQLQSLFLYILTVFVSNEQALNSRQNAFRCCYRYCWRRPGCRLTQARFNRVLNQLCHHHLVRSYRRSQRLPRRVDCCLELRHPPDHLDHLQHLGLHGYRLPRYRDQVPQGQGHRYH